MLNENSYIIHGDQTLLAAEQMVHFQMYEILLLDANDFFHTMYGLCTVNSLLVTPHHEEGAAP